MKHLQSKQVIIILIVAISIILIGALLTNKNDYSYQHDKREYATIQEPEAPHETIDIVVYLQDKESAIYRDCGITYPKKITVPKTIAVADASLTYLFQDELRQYGKYESVVIIDGVAQITLSSPHDKAGLKISSLSSCESRHLFRVLQDTLTQYETVDSVALYTLSGKIEF